MTMYRACLTLLTTACMCSFAPAMALAQASDDKYVFARQVSTLETYVASRTPAADDWELCRLLSDPRDQSAWLVKRTRELNTDKAVDPQKVTRVFAERARSRVEDWQRRGVKDLDGFDRSIGDILRAMFKLFEIVDPEQLASALKSKDADAAIGDCDPYELFVLFSRGVPESRLKRNTFPLDNWANRTVSLLSRAASLPGMDFLIADEYALTRPTLPSEGKHVAEAKVAGESALSAANGLLIRAMGGPAAGGAEMAAGEWNRMGQALESLNLWRWAALARLLEAASTSDATARTTAAQAADRLWKNVLAVEGATRSWTAMDGWIERVLTNRGDAEGQLPLGANYRAAALAARRRYEQEFVQAVRTGQDNAAFRAMQLAKAATAGVPEDQLARLETLSIEGVKDAMRKNNATDVGLYLEFLHVEGAGYYALAIHCTTCLFLEKRDDYESEWLPSNAGPVTLAEQIASAAISKVKVPAGEFAHTQVLVAPDPQQNDWLGVESQLLNCVGGTRTWVVCVPSASVLSGNGGWKLDRTLRLVRQWVVQQGRPLQLLTSGANAREFTTPLMQVSATKMIAITFGGAFPPSSPDRPYAEVLSDHRKNRDASTQNTIALLIRP